QPRFGTAASSGVVLNFNEVDIATMVKFISELTGKNFIMDERVKGKVSVFSPARLSTEEAFDLFTAVLELKGFTVVDSGKVLKIVPLSAAKQSGVRLLSGNEPQPVNESYIARLIPLQQISSAEAVAFLQPIISRDGHIAAFGPSNMLLVVDSARNIDKLMQILQVIDSEERRREVEVILLRNASAESVANIVRQWLVSRGQAQRGGQPGGAETVLADSRLNALLLLGRDQEKEAIRRLVAQLDTTPPEATGKVNVHFLENAAAEDVAKVLDGVIKGSAAVPGVPAQQSQFEGGKITITPDKATNSLVIMASAADYRSLRQVIEKLDRRRRQVFVEAVIAEISLDKLQDLGVQWGFFGGASNGKVATAGFYDPNNTFAPFFQLLQGVSNAGLTTNDQLTLGGVANFPVIIKALAGNGAANILSTPTILTSDNKEAEIFVGENIPLLSQSSLTSGGVSQQSIERKDTGITLRLTPQISEGEYVKLDIYQEISSVKESKGQAQDLVTTKRSAKTSVVVKNRETVIIGGLIQDRETETVRKVPLFGDIPLLGWFFKTRSTTREKINLMIALTPRIIRGAGDLEEVSAGAKSRFNASTSLKEPFAFSQEVLPKGSAAVPEAGKPEIKEEPPIPAVETAPAATTPSTGGEKNVAPPLPAAPNSEGTATVPTPESISPPVTPSLPAALPPATPTPGPAVVPVSPTPAGGEVQTTPEPQPAAGGAGQ
ncbi:MAG TPA: type II secretion system secretin GspD, partial [Geobacterales bacterium]|nr:type II secretion system secretin GspD [Geobacterales bacterium]